MKNAIWMDELIRRHTEIMDKYDKEKRIALVVDEWGCWHEAEPGTNPGFLYQQNTLRDALVAGITLNIFNNHADRVRIANLAQCVNVLQAVILTEGNKMILTPTYHIFDMFKGHMNCRLLDSQIASGVYTEGDIVLPMLNASSSISDDGTITVTVCNINPDKDTELTINIDEETGKIEKASGLILTGEKMNMMNTFKKTDELVPQKLKLKHKENSISFNLTAKSVVSLTLTTKK
jgi:alpha-N-arabinofuranosidase